ncbi:MAG: serine protease [Candidatus Bathyarchaeota archaeon]|nr:serine protease [Candidatus Bathyarchaeota archaeon]
MKNYDRDVKVVGWLYGILVVVAVLCGLMITAHALGSEVTEITVEAEVVRPVGPRLQAVSVNVLANRSQGSGTIFLTYIDGKQAAFIITANHVIDGLREVNEIIDADGSERQVIRYTDAQIIQEQVEDGRTVGEVKYDAKVLSVDIRRDIALLRVRKGDFSRAGATFYFGRIPTVGTEVYHCGAPGGKDLGGTSSLTAGIISRIGVRISGFGGGSEHGIFDQTDTAALGGSSGGMVALKSNGQWIGMITLGLGGGDSFHWLVPARSVKSWANEIGVMWLFDPSLDCPTEDDVSAIVLENQAGG